MQLTIKNKYGGKTVYKISSDDHERGFICKQNPTKKILLDLNSFGDLAEIEENDLYGYRCDHCGFETIFLNPDKKIGECVVCKSDPLLGEFVRTMKRPNLNLFKFNGYNFKYGFFDFNSYGFKTLAKKMGVNPSKTNFLDSVLLMNSEDSNERIAGIFLNFYFRLKEREACLKNKKRKH